MNVFLTMFYDYDLYPLKHRPVFDKLAFILNPKNVMREKVCRAYIPKGKYNDTYDIVSTFLKVYLMFILRLKLLKYLLVL